MGDNTEQSIREVGLNAYSYMVYLFDNVAERDRTPEVKAWLSECKELGEKERKRMNAERYGGLGWKEARQAERIRRDVKILQNKQSAKSSVSGRGIFSEFARKSKEEERERQEKLAAGYVECKYCGRLFKPKRDAAYCSRTCSTKYFNAMNTDYWRVYRREHSFEISQKKREKYLRNKERSEQKQQDDEICFG